MPWMYLCLTVAVVAVFAKLGAWQLSRAQEKIDMQEAVVGALHQPVSNSLPEIDGTQRYKRVELKGQYDFKRQFLRDNRIHKKQVGYEVLTPFYLDDDKNRAILVNRGWVPLGADRTIKPDVMPASDTVIVQQATGLLAQPSKGFTLGGAVDELQPHWPLVLQYIDYETIAAKLDKMSVVPAVIVLAPGQPLGYRYVWQPVANGPEKHYGYAFQWFAMMLAVIVLFIYLNFLKRK